MREALRRGTQPPFVIVAADCSANTQDRLLPLLKAREVRYVIGYRREELGGAIGRAPVSAVAVLDRSLGRRLFDVFETMKQ